MASNHDDDVLLPQLPEEIIFFHILTKLPTRSLLRFRSVSKSWNSATSHPLFLSLRRHHRRPTSLSHILISSASHLLSAPLSLRHPSPPTTLLLPFPEPRRPIVAKPANGLLLLHFPNHLYSDRPDLPAAVFNPGTREMFSLPQNGHNDNYEQKVKVLYYFGYDFVEGVYKVLQIWRFIDTNLERSERSLAFKIVTLGSGEWRWIRPDLPLFCSSYCALFSSSCVCNGGIHWVVRRKKCVLVFDLHDEQFRLIPFPQLFNNYHNHNQVNIEEEYLVELGTCLALLLKTSGVKKKMEMWVLKDYQKQKWVKEESFQYDMSDSDDDCRLIPARVPVPLGTVNEGDGEILLFKPMGKVEELGRLLYYDMKRRRFHGAEIGGLSEEWLSSNDAGDYSFDVYEENIMSLSSVLGVG